MLRLLLAVIPLGIGAAFTPSLFAVQLLAVAQEPWVRRALAAFLGAALAFGIALTVLLLGFIQLPTADGGSDPFGAALRIGAGVILAGVAVAFALPHPDMEARVSANVRHRVAGARARDFFGITFLLSIKDVSSFVLLIPALHAIGVADVNWVEKVIATLVLFTLALAGLIIPPIMRIVSGRRHGDVIQRIYAATMRNQFRIMAVVFAVLAVYLVVLGIRAW